MSVVLTTFLVSALLAQDSEGTEEVLPIVPQEQEEAPPAEPPPVEEDPRFDRPLSAEDIAEVVSQWAERFPGLARLETLGHDPSGRELQVLLLTDPKGGPAESKPGLLFVDFQAADGIFGSEAVLAFGWSLLHTAAEDAATARLLEDNAIYLAPALDPARRSGDDVGSPAPRFDLNFPMGWLPQTLRPGSGDFPLERAEAFAVAKFLKSRPNLTVIVGVAPTTGVAGTRGGGPWPGAELPDHDEEVLRELTDRLSEDTRLLSWDQLGSPGGGLFDYAYQAFGIYPVAWSGPGSELASEDIGAWLGGVVQGTRNLLNEMPRVRMEVENVSELARGLWELDVVVWNSGVAPTVSSLGQARNLSGDLVLSLHGADLIATAMREESDAPYQAADLHGGETRIVLGGGTLAGGEKRWLRLIVEAEDGAVIDLRASSTRGGNFALSHGLRAQ